MNKKIVIASILKPADDIRGFRKVAQSLAKTNKYDLNIIGNGGKNDINQHNIQFHSHSLHRTQWIKRIALRYLILLKLLRLKPALIVVATHELLAVGAMAKWLTKSKLIYDIQENYAANATLHGRVGLVISWLIRWKEQRFAKAVDQFWLAEKCYQEELGFVKDRALVIQNKPLPIKIDRPGKASPISALFSGTISDYSGARKAMKIMQLLAATYTDFRGVVIGQVHDPALEKWLIRQAQVSGSIELMISNDPVPYEEIIEQITQANLGIIAYQPNEISRNKAPTKLYEYARYQLPYLVQVATLWHRLGNRLGGAIPIDLNRLDEENLAKALKNRSPRFDRSYPYQDTWEFESSKLVDSIDHLLNEQ